jgi:SAM-dependent methyltransferase
MPDNANGYEELAYEYIRRRDTWIGPDVVARWAAQLTPGAEVLELGCGHGVVSQALLDAGVKLYAVDASPTLLAAFRKRFPQVPTECFPAEDSTFFARTFDAVVAWGLIFLMDESAQRKVLGKAASVLRPGGKLLFTSPRPKCTWIDTMTGRPSWSLGQDAYESLLDSLDLDVAPGEEDSGGNYYYFASRSKPDAKTR